MGNYRFRLSDMMPNAWFYKLKDMGNKGRKSKTNSRSMKKCYPTTRTSPPSPPKPSTPPSPEAKQALLPRRGSYYISSRVETEKFPNSPFHLKASDAHFLIDLPRRSKRRSRRKGIKPSPTTKLVASSVSAARSRRVWKSEAATDFPAASLESPPRDLHRCCIDGRRNDLHKPIISNKIEFDGFDGITSWSHSCSFWITTSATDIIIELGRKSSASRKFGKVKDCTVVSERELPRILTKPAKKEASAVKLDAASMLVEQEVYHNGRSAKEQSKSQGRKSPPRVRRLRMRESSPRLVSNGVQVQRCRKSGELAMTAGMHRRKGLRESFAIIMSSSDPQKDFRDSMVEMIVENNIRASKDLEELLACYLSLNSDEYHDVIVKVFEQILFDLTYIRL